MKALAQLKTLLPLPAVCGALLASLSLAPSAHAQIAYTTWAQSYGVGSYDGNGTPVTYDLYGSGSDAPAACVAMPDGGFVVAGGLDLPELYATGSGNTDHNGHSTTALVRYAADGRIMWQQALRQDNDTYDGTYKYYTFARNRVDQMLADAQGNLYLRMYKEPLFVTGPTATVAKFAPDGTLIWQAGYDGDVAGTGPTASAAGTYPFTSMSLTADGGVVVTGAEGAGGGSSQPYFAKINADGSLGAHRPFVNNGQYDGAGAAAQSADGTHFVVAMNAYGAVVLLDASNNILAERSFSNDANLGETPTAILANPDGTFTLMSIGYPTGGVYYTPIAYIVRKLAANLTPIWEKVIPNVTPGNSIQRTSDGGYLLTSVNAGNDVTGGIFGSTNSDAVVLRLDANGNLVSSFLFGGTDIDGRPADYTVSPGVSSVVQTADGGYGMAVASLSYHLPDSIDRSDWWLVKADPTGRVHGFQGIMHPVPTAYFNAHDNTSASAASNHYAGFPQGYSTTGVESYNPAPHFVIQNLATKTGVNKPTVLFQANPNTAPLLSPVTNLAVAVQAPAEVDSDYTFTTTDPDAVPGLFLRVQYNPTPLLESGWTDLPGGGQMTRSTSNPTLWTLRTNAVPQTTGTATTTNGLPIAFRAIAAAANYADSVSDFSSLLDVAASTVPVFKGSVTYTLYATGPQVSTQDFSLFLTSLFSPRASKVVSISGLPPGVTLNSDVYLYGRPTQAGTYTVNFQVVENVGGRTANGSITLNVLPTPALTSALTATAIEGRPFSYQIAVSNFTPATYGFYSYDFSGLPRGLSFDSTTGLVTGTVDTTVFPGDYRVSISASDANNDVSVSDYLTLTIKSAAASGTADLKLTVSASPEPVIVGGTVRYNFSLKNNGPNTATNLKGQVAIASDALTLVTTGSAPGITVNGNTYSFPLPDLASGASPETYTLVFTANTVGSYTVTAGVTADQADPTPTDANTSFTTTVKAGSTAAHAPVITAAPGGQIIVGEAFRYQITTDGTVPVDTYTATVLPDGLSVDGGTGLISGTLEDGTVSGNSFTLTLRAANGAGASTTMRTFTVVPAPTNPKVIDVTATFGDGVVVKLLADKGKYKLTGTLSLSNLGTKAFNGVSLPGQPPKPPLNVGLYLSNSPTFSYPLTSDPTAVGLLPLAVTVTSTLDSTTGVVNYSAKVTVPSGNKTASLISLPIKVAKGGKSPLIIPFSLKASASDLPAQVTSGQYRYLLVVLDPTGSIASESSKSNNTAALDLQRLLGNQ